MNNRILMLTLILALNVTVACGSSSNTNSSSVAEDTSPSGSAASAVGGALGSSDTNGTIAMNKTSKNLWSLFIPEAYASNACPTIRSTNGFGCSNNGNAADMGYASCSFGSSLATWSGTMEMSLSSGTAVSCGTFPDTATIANGQSIQRQFVTAGNPGTVVRTSSMGRIVTIDDASANLANFDSGTTFSPIIGTGYGSQVVFDGTGKRKQVIVNERVFTTAYDHSIIGTLNVSETGTTRTIATGSVSLYHNLLRVIALSQFTDVVYNNTCCTPVSGSITTTFSAGAHVAPTKAGELYVGKTETLTITGCGTGTLLNAAGALSSVALNSCF